MQYRPEVDGLRALAVLPVILYHAKLPYFQGGFVGVDVFFVISGYLITRIILSEIFTSSFSLVNFYERRARRILPALFCVLTLSTALAWILLPPSELKDFGQSLFSVSFFISNFLFWIEGGYFDLGTDFKSLVHTWSLAVEEQFYILFPLFVLFVYGLNRRAIFPLMFLSLFISLYLAHIFSDPSQPTEVRQAAFFSLPTRAWELMLGGVLFLANQKKFIYSNTNINNFLSFIGLVLICYSILFFNESTPFPSLYSLVPTIGAALILLFSLRGTFANKILTFYPIVFIGLVSYSAYLIHQPLLSFSRYYFLDDLTFINIIFILLFTFLLSYLSWNYIEQPFRDKNKISRKNIFMFSLSGCLVFGALGLSIHINEGFKDRYTNEEVLLLDFQSYEKREELYKNRICFLRKDQDSFGEICKKGNIYLWGDSHAASLSFGMNQISEITQFTTSMCPPILNYEIIERPYCQSINQYVFDSIEIYKPEIIYLSANWIFPKYEGAETNFLKTLESLSIRYPNVEFIILGGLPQWFPSLPVVMLRAGQSLDGDGSYLENKLFDKVYSQDLAIKKIINKLDKNNLRFLSLLDMLCKDQQCLTKFQGDETEPISFDYAHLTAGGSVVIASLISDYINSGFEDD